MQEWGTTGVLVACGLVTLPWLVVVLNMRPPRNLTNLVLQLAPDGEQRAVQLEALRSSTGVEDLMLLADEGIAYLKVDESLVDPELVAQHVPAA